jgi:HEAT repeat protein
VKRKPAAPSPELAFSIEALHRRLLHTYLAGLGDLDHRARKKAARGLGYLGRAAAEAAPALRALCDDENRSVRHVARWALDRIAG